AGESTAEVDPLDESGIRCEACQGNALTLISETPRPSWWQVLDHLDERCPWWHADASKAALVESLERDYGVDYETWLQETRIESARGTAKRPPATQLTFPELDSSHDFLVELF
ncbi:MAG: hypothetical protein WBD31_08225, partial [Rubripirellula sp.]